MMVQAGPGNSPSSNAPAGPAGWLCPNSQGLTPSATLSAMLQHVGLETPIASSTSGLQQCPTATFTQHELTE